MTTRLGSFERGKESAVQARVVPTCAADSVVHQVFWSRKPERRGNEKRSVGPLPPSKPPTGPAPPRRSVCAPGRSPPPLYGRSLSRRRFPMWFRNLFDYLASTPSRTPAGRARRVASRRRPAAGRLQLEALEDRCLLSFSPAVNYPVGLNPYPPVTGDFNGDGRLDLAVANTHRKPA